MFAINNLKLYYFYLCASSHFFFFFLRAADWPTTTFPEMDYYFPVIRLVNFV